MRRPPKIIHLLVLSALISAGCSSNLVKSLSALNALQQHLTQKYGDQVTVNLQNSRYLSIVFVNSPLNHDDESKRLERAHDAAQFVALNYEEIKSVEQVWIAFMASETRMIIFHYNQVIDSFGFDRNGASLAAATTRNGVASYDESKRENDARAPQAVYNPRTNQTDISVTRIQLEGTVNRGLALVPHFTVEGDARTLGTAIQPPEYVVLDFASYSEKPIFDGNPTLEIYCDDRLALKGFAQLLSGQQSGIDETIGQFASTRVPFRLLQRMAKSNRVTIVVAAKRFQLLPDDVVALARIAAYVPNSNNNQQ